MVDARIPCVLVVKISYFSNLFCNLCAISKVALLICIWLIFMFDFDLDDDLYWIQASLTKQSLLSLVFSSL
jgi:hypothetical protein